MNQTIILENLASVTEKGINEHLKRIIEYKNLHLAWVIRFTCEDNYPNKPHWQSDKYIREGVFLGAYLVRLRICRSAYEHPGRMGMGDVQKIDSELLCM